jgi:hypothetical protein
MLTLKKPLLVISVRPGFGIKGKGGWNCGGTTLTSLIHSSLSISHHSFTHSLTSLTHSLAMAAALRVLLALLCFTGPTCEGFRPLRHSLTRPFSLPLVTHSSTHSLTPLRVLPSTATATATDDIVSERVSERVVIVSESEEKSATLRRLLLTHSFTHSLTSNITVEVITCPSCISELPYTQLSPRTRSLTHSFSPILTPRTPIPPLPHSLTPVFTTLHTPDVVHSLQHLQQCIANSTLLILALDNDQQGEFLASTLLTHTLTHTLTLTLTLTRMKLLDLTPSSLHKWLSDILASQYTKEKMSSVVDSSVVDSYVAKRVVDRVVSLTLSQALHQCVGEYYSAGRVQSRALCLVVEVSDTVGRVVCSVACSSV